MWFDVMGEIVVVVDLCMVCLCWCVICKVGVLSIAPWFLGDDFWVL